jgi:hypothetical protein
MNHIWIRIPLYGWFVLLLAACNGAGAPTLPDEGLAVPAFTQTVAGTQTIHETTPPIQGSEMTQSAPPSGMEILIEKAKEDLARRLSIPSTQIILVEAIPVVWPDASLGCPQPGMKYIQVPEDGLLVRLQAGEQMYEYHSGGFRDPFLCEQMYKDPNPPPKIDFFNLTPSGSTKPDNSIPPGEDK